MNDGMSELIRRIAAAAAEDEGAEIVEFKVHCQGAGGEIRVLVDKNGGISMDTCAGINRAIIARMEEGGISAGGYVVEVCSPGLDRPLKTVQDFRRVMSQHICCMVRTQEGKTRDLTGVVAAVGEQDIALMQDDGRHVTIAINDVVKAKLEVRW